MSQVFRSAAEFIQQPLDCRRLTLSLQYYQLLGEQVLALAEYITRWVSAFTDGKFFLDCSCNGSSIRENAIFRKMADALKKENCLSMRCDAYTVSPLIHDKNSLRKFRRDLKKAPNIYSFSGGTPSTSWGPSLDYTNYFDQRFPVERPENGEIIDLVYQLFQETGRVYRSLHVWSDLDGRLTAKPYQSDPHLYHGSAYLSFSAFCLGNYLLETAERMARLAEELAGAVVHVNAHVALQPAEYGTVSYRSPYMQFFGRHMEPDGSAEANGYAFEEWYPTYYLCGVEWFNLLSPLTAVHMAGQKNPDIRETPWGGMIARSPKSITEYDVPDVLELKRVLRPALYPGASSIPLRNIFPWKNTPRIYDCCPRFNWSIVPIEKHEIRIIGSDIVFDASCPIFSSGESNGSKSSLQSR